MNILTAKDDAFTVGEERKLALHRSTASALRKVADELGLAKGSYDIRSNKAGPACSGEVTLHGESVYIQAGGLCGVLVRSCKGRKDYGGGANHWFKPEDLLNPKAFAEEVRKVIGGTSAHVFSNPMVSGAVFTGSLMAVPS